jgi:hypothetical protein
MKWIPMIVGAVLAAGFFRYMCVRPKADQGVSARWLDDNHYRSGQRGYQA